MSSTYRLAEDGLHPDPHGTWLNLEFLSSATRRKIQAALDTEAQLFARELETARLRHGMHFDWADFDPNGEFCTIEEARLEGKRNVFTPELRNIARKALQAGYDMDILAELTHLTPITLRAVAPFVQPRLFMPSAAAQARWDEWLADVKPTTLADLEQLDCYRRDGRIRKSR